jgi:hypothetical protein
MIKTSIALVFALPFVFADAPCAGHLRRRREVFFLQVARIGGAVHQMVAVGPVLSVQRWC